MSTLAESKHTPGPWKWDTDKVGVNGELEPEETGWFHQGPDLMGPNDQRVLTSWGHDADGINVSAANARLIAAAPALLQALEEMVAFGKRQGWAHVAIINAEDAIRLAKGESHV